MAQLTLKQRIFVDEYLIDLNATQAAIRAGYSKKTAYRTGADNLIKPQIQAQIQKRMKDREERTEITQDFVLRELYAIANANGADFAKVVKKSITQPVLDDEGSVIQKEEFYNVVEIEPTDEIPDEKKKAIAGIKQGKHGIEVNTCDKIRALELLGRHLGMFTDKVKVDVGSGFDMLESIMIQLKE
ncbi:terminase small subunit [Acetivibrio cellulolyticus]|uniref:terminase small subunit n=1 Tax=Acetivibrio cellulolyticus TaxID=35830 RepID=UPI0001E2D975|nr:terminase small subunit [Acetivibrio cellulolyticus]